SEDLEAGAAAKPYRRSEEPSFVTLLVSVLISVLLVVALSVMERRRRPSVVSVHLTGYDGIDPGGAGRVVSPAFNITLRLNDTCVDRADVAVLYSGVALGWARVDPRDCAKRRWAKDVEVVARGAGVGLSQRLRDRMASDWRSGAVELDVDVTTYKEDPPSTDTEFPQDMIVKKVRIFNEKEEQATTDASSQMFWSA
uniref:Late embryogenesis abundant protein LEA-2 subgroup domain-containing protein n=1 Tax=Aegilops tauschii subsp. strangulata TaxID=200361 RepID=A0A453FMA1_AEGTS